MVCDIVHIIRPAKRPIRQCRNIMQDSQWLANHFACLCVQRNTRNVDSFFFIGILTVTSFCGLNVGVGFLNAIVEPWFTDKEFLSAEVRPCTWSISAGQRPTLAQTFLNVETVTTNHWGIIPQYSKQGRGCTGWIGSVFPYPSRLQHTTASGERSTNWSPRETQLSLMAPSATPQ